MNQAMDGAKTRKKIYIGTPPVFLRKLTLPEQSFSRFDFKNFNVPMLGAGSGRGLGLEVR